MYSIIVVCTKNNLRYLNLKYINLSGKSGASKITEKGFENITSKVACYVPEDEVILFPVWLRN